jgi:hypothetical protein
LDCILNGTVIPKNYLLFNPEKKESLNEIDAIKSIPAPKHFATLKINYNTKKGIEVTGMLVQKQAQMKNTVNSNTMIEEQFNAIKTVRIFLHSSSEESSPKINRPIYKQHTG